MQAILFVSEDCDLCKEAEKKFKEVFAEELKNDEAVIMNVDKDEGGMEFWATHQLPNGPVVVITTDSGKVVDSWDTGEIPDLNDPKIYEKQPVDKTT